MRRCARAGSTGLKVAPSTFRLVPTITASATAKMSAIVSARTPVLATTVASGTASLAAIRSLIANCTPAAGPLIRIASAPRNAAPFARSAMPRLPMALANSGEMLSNSATSPAPIASR